MSPVSTGSVAAAMTIGIVLVAFLAAWTAGVPHVTITSTLRRTSSAARVRERFNLPVSEPRLDGDVHDPLHTYAPANLGGMPRCWGQRRSRKRAYNMPTCGNFFVVCCASAKGTTTKTKPTSKTPIALLAIPACLLRFIAGCPERFSLPLAHRIWHSWQPCP